MATRTLVLMMAFFRTGSVKVKLIFKDCGTRAGAPNASFQSCFDFCCDLRRVIFWLRQFSFSERCGHFVFARTGTIVDRRGGIKKIEVRPPPPSPRPKPRFRLRKNMSMIMVLVCRGGAEIPKQKLIKINT